MKTTDLDAIDALIQKHIFGYKVTTFNRHHPEFKRQTNKFIYLVNGGYEYVPRYSKNIKDAWEVVEKLRENYFEISIDIGEDIVNVEISTTINNPKKVYCAYQEEKTPLAICLAALKSVEEEVTLGKTERG